MVLAVGEKFTVTKDGVEYEFELADEGGYIARVPAYPSCISQGETFEEALEMIQEGLVEILDTARELGLEIPASLKHVGVSN